MEVSPIGRVEDLYPNPPRNQGVKSEFLYERETLI
jgi:hypothetical protein